jgi:hypothetical protein
VGTILATVFSALSLLLVQAWHIKHFCLHAQQKSTCDVSSAHLVTPSWCPPCGYLDGSWGSILKNLTAPYTHVQEKYWGVQFLAQWTPNNALSLAIILPAFVYITVRYLHRWYLAKKIDVITLGVAGVLFDATPPRTHDVQTKNGGKDVFTTKANDSSRFPVEVAFWFHALFLVTVAVCYVYVLVSST